MHADVNDASEKLGLGALGLTVKSGLSRSTMCKWPNGEALASRLSLWSMRCAAFARHPSLTSIVSFSGRPNLQAIRRGVMREKRAWVQHRASTS